MAKKEITYDQAMVEIEQILERFRSEQMSIDELATQVTKASEMIELCRTKLRKAEEDVAKILEV